MQNSAERIKSVSLDKKGGEKTFLATNERMNINRLQKDTKRANIFTRILPIDANMR
jgi:hypothetical protein